jgi:hypothetical protein
LFQDTIWQLSKKPGKCENLLGQPVIRFVLNRSQSSTKNPAVGVFEMERSKVLVESSDADAF